MYCKQYNVSYTVVSSMTDKNHYYCNVTILSKAKIIRSFKNQEQ